MKLFNLKPVRKNNAIVLEKRKRFAIALDLKDKTYVYFVYNPFIDDYSYIERKKKSKILSPLVLYVIYWILRIAFYLFLVSTLPILYFVGCWNFIRNKNNDNGVWFFGAVNFGIVIGVIIKEIIYHLILKQ